MTKLSIFLCTFILLRINSYSQDLNGSSSMQNTVLLSEDYCHTHYLHEKKLNSDLGFNRRSYLADKKIHDRLQDSKLLRTESITYTIPVVIHLIHQNGLENISDKQIKDGIKHLNDAFNANPPFNGIGGAVVNIQFCLAKQDTNGNFTSGINRIISPLTNIDISNDQALKDLIRWDPKKYINIWLVNEICSGANCSIAGFAYMAAAHGLPYDGIVNEARWFGSSPNNSKVHIHELGHYFNLYHTFQNGCKNYNCMLDGDKVCDTPPDNSSAPVFPCASFYNSCSSDSDDPSSNNPFRSKALGGLGDVNDQFNNYMDYGAQQCQNIFTLGQSDRMRAALLGPRASLLNSSGCNDPCTNIIYSNFTSPSPIINAGTTVSFINNSTGATSYEWKINDTLFSSVNSPSYNFISVGQYTITLTASNNDPACTKNISSFIKVTCPITANFTSSSTTILKNNSIIFSNASLNANTYQWLIDGVYNGNNINLNYTFLNSGIYSITLISGDGYCEDTSSTTIIVNDSCIVKNKETNIWYFGNKAGLNFNTATPTVLSNSAMITNEGCSVISDQNGNLLFYTNGITVWNKTHTIMVNGFGLMGHTSSTQSAIIVPHPGNNNQYYIFTTTFHGTTNGLRYSIVDLSLGGGLGAVLTKNILLYTPTSEKVTAIKHSNQKDFWIITHDFYSSNFRIYLIDGTGLNPIPLIQNIGINHGGAYVFSAQGYITASPQGDKIAISADFTNTFELFDFNNITGTLSNPITFNNYNRIYGLEFSPNGKLLYASSWINPCKLYQFNLSGGTYLSINNSATLLASYNSDYQACALKAGPDGKIYVARTGTGALYLGRINFPNVPGVGCDYVDNAVNLSPASCFYGLPNMISLNNKPKPDFNYSTSCANKTTFTLIGDTVGKFKWIFGEPSSGAEDTSFNFFPEHTYSSGTTHLVQLIKTTACETDTIQKNISVNLQFPIPHVNLGKDSSFCDSITLILNAGTGFNYLWNDASTNQTKVINSAGKYWVEISNSNFCKASDTIEFFHKGNSPSLNLKDTSICEGQICTFDAGIGYNRYLWNDGTFDQKLTAFLPGKYKVTVTNNCGTSLDSALLNILPFPLVSFSGLDSSYCIFQQTAALKGNPDGGIFSGPGISENNFNPNLAELGTNFIIYKYTSPNGCKGSNKQKVLIQNSCELFIPNLITPNGDGLNDKFEIIGLPKNSEIEICNRWGKLIYKNNDYDNSWGGEDVSDGVYYIKFTYGSNKKTYIGWLHVLK